MHNGAGCTLASQSFMLVDIFSQPFRASNVGALGDIQPRVLLPPAAEHPGELVSHSNANMNMNSKYAIKSNGFALAAMAGAVTAMNIRDFQLFASFVRQCVLTQRRDHWTSLHGERAATGLFLGLYSSMPSEEGEPIK